MVSLAAKRRPDPGEWQRPAMAAALATLDMTRVLQKVGFSQQQIAGLTGQSQPEVSAIIHGRRVMAFSVLRRIVEGLGAPACLAGMTPCQCHRLCPVAGITARGAR